MGFSFSRISIVRSLWLGSVALAEIACGQSSSDTGDVAANGRQLEAVCDAQCDHELRCGDPPSATCSSDCRARLGEPSVLSQQALHMYTECLNDAACIDDDICEDQVQQRSATIDRTVKDCLAFVRTCPFEADLSACLRIAFLVPDLRARLASCYVGTCTYDSFTACGSTPQSG